MQRGVKLVWRQSRPWIDIYDRSDVCLLKRTGRDCDRSPRTVISVLYIDDEPDLLEITRLFLQQHPDLNVDTERSARGALDRIRKNPRSHDVIISDYQMPELDGISLLKEIRSIDPAIPFIIFTGKGREDIVIEALNNGADFYLQKGGDPASQFAELEHKIRLAFERRAAREKIVFLNRLYAVLSQINLAIVRTRSQEILLSEVCHIAVSTGKFRLAWVGMIDYQHMNIDPVSWDGFGDQTPGSIGIYSTARRQEYCRGLQTILEGRHFICKNLDGYPNDSPVQQEARTFGYKAFGSFPLKFHEKIVGALFVYATDPELFSEEEIDLLIEVASDISFALESIEEELHRVVAEAALRDSEQRYRVFIDSMNDMVFLKDTEFRYVVINKALENYFGTTEKGILGRTDFDLMPVPLAEQCLDSDKRTLEENRVTTSLEYHEKLVYESHKFPVKFRDGRTFIGGYIRNITREKDAEEQLKASEEKYRIVANNTFDWELWWSPVENFIYVSPSVERVTGHLPEEFMKDPDLLWRIIHPDDRRDFQKHQQDVVETKEPGEVEFRVIRPDGSIRWIDHVCEPVYSDDGKYLGHRAANRDITERKDLEEQLFRFSQIQMSLIQNAHLWLMILDENGDVKVWNTGAEQISGYTSQEAVGKNRLWKDLYPDKGYRAFVTTRIREIIEKNDYFENLETTIYTKSGETRNILWNTQKLAGHKDEPVSYIAVGRDITSSRIAQKTIESLERFMNNNPDPVLRIDRNGVILDANRASSPILAAWETKAGGTVPGEIRSRIQNVLETMLPATVIVVAGTTSYAFDLFPNREDGHVTAYGRVCTGSCPR